MDRPSTKKFVGPACSDRCCSSSGIERCPFSRNINESTNISFSSSTNMSIPVQGMRGPIFTDGPHFDIALRLFRGRDSVAPTSGLSLLRLDNPKPDISQLFNPLAAKAATISLSGFGSGGPFSFDFFSQNWKKDKQRSKSI